MNHDRSQSPATATAQSPGGSLKMKDSLSRGNSAPPVSSQFPPVGAPSAQGGSKFFNKGPIKPPTNLAMPV